MYDFRYISIYYDSNKIIGVPCGKDPKQGEYGVAELDIFLNLNLVTVMMNWKVF